MTRPRGCPTGEPYFSVRPHATTDSLVLLGGQNHRTGHGDGTAERSRPLERQARELFDPNRFKPLASKSIFLSHNTETMQHYFADYLGSRPNLDPSDLDPGDAGVYETDDDPVAVYRDDDGEIHARSAVCPHMSCLVTWNDGERSWDCPCHGSRFDVDGDGLDTPAADGLEDVSLPDGSDS